MSGTGLKINGQRLEHSLCELASIGCNEQGGMDRTAFSPSDLQAREWLVRTLSSEGFGVKVDEAGNIWGRRGGSVNGLPSIVCGSHIDTVPNGGKYDGALGVLIALEVLRTLEETGTVTRHPMVLVSFSAEEPNPFGFSTFGSRAAAGKLKAVQITDARNPEGRLLTDALNEAGGCAERLEAAALRPDTIAAYLEVHIEQGKRLLARRVPVGIVTSITGIRREEITVLGEANHAGTTLMDDRTDSLAAAAELILAAEKICRSAPVSEVVGTIGQMKIFPNAANIIPGEVRLTAEFRGATGAQLEHVLEAWKIQVGIVTMRRGVRIERRVLLDQAPVLMDREVIRASERQAERLRVPYLRLGSMAGHDAVHMAAVTRSGMLFVPSIGGKSHCPEEQSRMEDILLAADVLLQTLLDLDLSLDQEGGRQ